MVDREDHKKMRRAFWDQDAEGPTSEPRTRLVHEAVVVFGAWPATLPDRLGLFDRFGGRAAGDSRFGDLSRTIANDSRRERLDD